MPVWLQLRRVRASVTRSIRGIQVDLFRLGIPTGGIRMRQNFDRALSVARRATRTPAARRYQTISLPMPP